MAVENTPKDEDLLEPKTKEEFMTVLMRMRKRISDLEGDKMKKDKVISDMEGLFAEFKKRFPDTPAPAPAEPTNQKGFLESFFDW